MKLVIEKNPEKKLTFKERKMRVGKDFIYHESSQPFYKIKVLLKNLEKEPELYVNKIEKKVYQIPQLINFLKNFEELKKGKAKIHGGAVANDKQEGIFYGACQDVGKTTLALLLAKEGYYLIADDVVRITQEGKLERVQKEMGIYPHPNNLKNLNLSRKEKFFRWFKYHFIRFPFLYRFCYPNLRVNYFKIGKVLDEAPLERVYILERGNPETSEIDKETAIKKVMASSLELFLPEGFPKRLFYNYCFANNLWPTFLEDKYKEVLEAALEGKKYFLLRGENPFDFYNLFLKNEKK